jgi:hypothetical protein
MLMVPVGLGKSSASIFSVYGGCMFRVHGGKFFLRNIGNNVTGQHAVIT